MYHTDINLSKHEILKQQPNVNMKAYNKYFGGRTIIEMAQPLMENCKNLDFIRTKIMCALFTKPISIS